MRFRNILYYSEILGRERPEVKRMIQTAMFNHELSPIIENHMLQALKNQGYDLTNLPLFSLNLPEDNDRDGVFAGKILFGNGRTSKLIIPVDSFERHALICGITRSGKSTLAKFIIPQLMARGIYPVIFDPENEYSVLLKVLNPEDVVILDSETDRDNPFEPSPGCDPRFWLPKVINLMREAFYLRDGAANLLFMILNNLLMNRDVYSGSENYPTVLDVVNFLDTLEFKAGTRFYSYLESLKNRFRGELLGSMGNVLSCRRGYSPARLERKCRIYRSRGMSNYMRNFYIGLKMMRELTCREYSQWKDIKTLFVIDEAHKLYNKEIAKRHDLGEPMVFSNARTFAKRGIICFYIDQIPSLLPPALGGNVGNVFVQRLTNGGCVTWVSRRMGLNAEEQEFIPVMPKRQWLFQSGEFPDPVLFEVPEIRFEQVGEEDVRKHMEKILPSLEYTPVAEKLKVTSERAAEELEIPGQKKTRTYARPNKLWKGTAKILAELGYIGLTDLYANLGNISPWFGRKNIAAMEKQGMIETCPISFGTRGNPKTFVVLRPKGAEFIGVDYEDVRLQGKGSTEHVILQNLLAERMKDSGKTVEIEYSASGKSVDIAELREDGAVAYEIELSPSHRHVVENVLKDLEAGFDEVVVVTRNQVGQNEAKDRIYKSIAWEKLSRIKFKLIRQFL